MLLDIDCLQVQLKKFLAEHKDVAECAVLGIADKLKGQIPIGLLALKAGVTKNKKEIIH